MANMMTERFTAFSAPRRGHLILLSPIAVVILGQVAARTLGPLIGIWSWLPLSIGYWLTVGMLVAWLGGRRAIKEWLRPSEGSRFWLMAALLIAVVPTVPMLFPDTWRLFIKAEILLPTLLFVLINPPAEETYWRGLLLDSTIGKSGWLIPLYSSVLFTINHMWMAVMVIGARNPMGATFQFVFPLLMCAVRVRTRSLRWPIVAHFLANLLTPTVPVFLNLYIPGAAG